MPTGNPKATDITRAIYARLQAISVANGYRTEIGASLYRGRAALYRNAKPGDPPWGALFVETDEIQTINKHAVTAERIYVVEVHIPAADQPDAPPWDETQDAILWDLRKAIADATTQIRLSGLAAEATQGLATLDSPVLGSEKTVVIVPIRVVYAELHT